MTFDAVRAYHMSMAQEQKTPQMRLRLARVERVMNQSELAAMLKTSQAQASRIETGKQRPSLEQAFVLEREFGIPAESWIKAAA